MRILVVDDNKDFADSVTRLVRAWGFGAQPAYDGQSAVEKAQEYDPGVIFIDIGLPDVDGYTLAKRFRQQAKSKNARLFAVTGWDTWGGNALEETPFDDYLMKPIPPGILKRRLQRLKEAIDTDREAALLDGSESDHE